MKADITVRNFRSIRDLTFPIREGLNVIVGANGSGKTNLLRALKFLSDIVTSGASLAMAKAGGPSRNFRRGQDHIEFSIESPLDSSFYRGRRARFKFHWDITVAPSGPDGFVQVSQESFRISAQTNETTECVFQADISRSGTKNVKSKFWIAPREHLTKRLFESSRLVNSSSRKEEIFDSLTSSFQSALSDAKKGPRDASFLQRASRAHEGMRRVFQAVVRLDEYNISPEAARQAVDPLPVRRMKPDGAGVSEVIAALEADHPRRLSPWEFVYPGYSPYIERHPFDIAWMARPDRNALSEIVEHLQAAVSSIDTIATEIDPSTGRRFVVFKSGGHKFLPQEISDGTFKWLCLLVALYVPTSKVVLLEEPENFMHPWMQQRFIALARKQSRKDSGSVVISTHSVTVLNALVPDELRICFQEDGETHIHCVSDEAEIREMLKNSSFGLGDLWVSGGIGGVTGGN